MLLLAGCGESGGPAGPPGARPMVGPPGPMKPESAHTVSIGPSTGIKPASPVGMPTPDTSLAKDKPDSPGVGSKPGDNPLAPVLKVEQAGDPVNLASEIIAAGVNPFLSRLPKPLLPDTEKPDQTPQVAEPPAADPLDSVKLLGIVYNPKTPIALVAITGGKYPSQVVRTGDLLALDAGQALVSRITQQSIDIQLMGAKKENRTMTIPDIVGYNSLKANPSESPEAGETSESGVGGTKVKPPSMPEMPSTPPVGRTSKSSANAPSPLSNLKKLSNSSSNGNGTNSNSPDVVLTEP